MVWDRDALEDGFELLEPRLRDAFGGDDGWWLLIGWGRGGFEHRSRAGASTGGAPSGAPSSVCMEAGAGRFGHSILGRPAAHNAR